MYDARDSHPPRCHFERSEKSFSSPFSHDSFAKPFTGSTAHLSATRCFPFLAVRRSPSDSQRKRSLDFARDDDTGNVLFPHILCMMHGIAIPHAVISSAARNLFRPLFPTTPLLSRLREAPSAFPRYGVSVSCYQTCTINKRAMNKTVHGSFICTPAGIIPNP